MTSICLTGRYSESLQVSGRSMVQTRPMGKPETLGSALGIGYPVRCGWALIGVHVSGQCRGWGRTDVSLSWTDGFKVVLGAGRWLDEFLRDSSGYGIDAEELKRHRRAAEWGLFQSVRLRGIGRPTPGQVELVIHDEGAAVDEGGGRVVGGPAGSTDIAAAQGAVREYAQLDLVSLGGRRGARGGGEGGTS